MKIKKPKSWIQWIRRCVQAFMLISFVVLTYRAAMVFDGQARSLLSIFFNIDPLVLISTWLSTYTVPKLTLLALITIAATVLLGRVFCGWICPFGAFNQLITWFRKRPKGKFVHEERTVWQRGKYILLIFLLVMAAFGVHWTGIFDPMPLFYRSLTTFVLPGIQYAVEDGSTATYQANPGVGPFRATVLTEPVYRFFRDRVFLERRRTFYGALTIGGIFLLIAGLNFVKPRFWCRYICPLGGLLGLLSLRPVLRLHNDKERCTRCGLCARTCPAAAQPQKPGEWLPTECYACWNCVATCNQNALSFTLSSPVPRPEMGQVDFPRRTVLASGFAGLVGLVWHRTTPFASPNLERSAFAADLIRPPGARPERDFLKRCIQCGMCMRACPNNALHPAGVEAGLEALWTPKLVPKRGYCELYCNMCGQVCPTDAIQEVPVEEKENIRIGLAFFDTTRCIPYAYGRDCMICEEHCPLSPKAIYFVETEVRLRGDVVRTIKQPKIDPDRCIGCGICEYSCVFQDRAAVRVTSANESRNSINHAILPGMGFDQSVFDAEAQQDGGFDPYG